MKKHGLFKKKPIPVECWQWEGALEGAPKWVIDNTEYSGIGALTGKLLIHTLEGPLVANLNDYIIKGVRGEVYPCERSIFEETYEEVDD